MEEDNIWQSHYWHCQEWTQEGESTNDYIPNIPYKSDEIKIISKAIAKF